MQAQLELNFSSIKAHLDAGKLIVLGTTIKGFGHVVLVKGYTNDGRFITNDPYWGKPGHGEVIYTRDEFGGTPFMVLIEDAVASTSTVSVGTGSSTPPPTTTGTDMPVIVGQGMSPSQQTRFRDAYRRVGGAATLGAASKAAYQVKPPTNLRWVQNFQGGAWGNAVLEMDDSQTKPMPSLSLS